MDPDCYERMEFLKAVIHNIIERNFADGWTSEEFLKHYDTYMRFLKGGIQG